MNRHKIPFFKTPIFVLRGHLDFYKSEGNRRAVEEYELAIEVLTSVGIK